MTDFVGHSLGLGAIFTMCREKERENEKENAKGEGISAGRVPRTKSGLSPRLSARAVGADGGAAEVREASGVGQRTCPPAR